MADATQGPWRVKLKPRKWEPHMCCAEQSMWVIKGPNSKHSPVAMIRTEGLGAGPSMAVREANARLIAAAPDLLAVLTEAYSYMVDYRKCENNGLLKDMEAAIAKTRENPE
jgi:hypothetical protein